MQESPLSVLLGQWPPIFPTYQQGCDSSHMNIS